MIESLIKSAGKQGKKWSNWAGNVECLSEQIFFPKNEAEIVEIIHFAKANGKRIRVVGEGHSFSPLIETEDYIISLRALSGVHSVDKENKVATIWSGTSIKKANEILFEHDLALRNLGDIDVQSLGGATATGTHGTGINFGNVSAEIIEFTIVTAAGEILNCNRHEHPDLFAAGRVSLGVLGIITKITLNVDRAYKLEFKSSAGDFEETLEKLDDYNEQNRNFEFYYFPYSNTIQLKESNKTNKPIKFNKYISYFNDVLMENNVMQLVCGIGTTFPKSSKRLSKFMAWGFTKETKINYSHKVYATVRNVRFKEMEYNIPAEHFKDCIKQLKQMVEQNEYGIFFPVECRFVQSDDIWLSPAYGRASAYIAVHVYANKEHDPYFADMEQLFNAYAGRPHWGKMHTRKADYFSKNYEKWDDFLALREKMDPTKLFLNPHLEGVFGV